MNITVSRFVQQDTSSDEIIVAFVGHTGFLQHAISTFAGTLDGTMRSIRSNLLRDIIVHTDEIGIRTESGLSWRTSTNLWPYQHVSKKRGKEGSAMRNPSKLKKGGYMTAGHPMGIFL